MMNDITTTGRKSLKLLSFHFLTPTPFISFSLKTEFKGAQICLPSKATTFLTDSFASSYSQSLVINQLHSPGHSPTARPSPPPTAHGGPPYQHYLFVAVVPKLQLVQMASPQVGGSYYARTTIECKPGLGSRMPEQ